MKIVQIVPLHGWADCIVALDEHGNLYRIQILTPDRVRLVPLSELNTGRPLSEWP